MDSHISPRLYENKYKKNAGLPRSRLFPGRQRMDTRKYPDSQLKSVGIVVRSQVTKSTEAGSASDGSRARLPRNKPALPTFSCEELEFGQKDHSETILSKKEGISMSPSPQLKSIKCANASSSCQNGEKICSESSQSNPIRSCEVNSCKDSANMSDKIEPNSPDLVVVDKFIEDQLEPLATLDRSVSIDNSDTSTVTADLPGEETDSFFKIAPSLESKIVWREGLLQRWKALKNLEIDSSRLLSSCAGLEQKFPQPTKFGGPSVISDVFPSSPGSDTSTSSNLSLLSSVWSGQPYCRPLNNWNIPFSHANQNLEARSEQSQKARLDKVHEVAAIPTTITLHPHFLPKICLQESRFSVDRHSNYRLDRSEEEDRGMIYPKSSREHILSRFETPLLSADNKKETTSENQKDPASLTRRSTLWTHREFEDGKHASHRQTRKSAVPFLDEVLEVQGIRDVHVVEIPFKKEFTSALPLSSAGSGFEADLIDIPKSIVSDIISDHTHQKACTNLSSGPNTKFSLTLSSGSTNNNCKKIAPEENRDHHRHASARQLESNPGHSTDDEYLCRCYQHTQEKQKRGENSSASYTFIVAATASAGLLVVGTCLVGYIWNRRFRSFRKFRLNAV